MSWKTVWVIAADEGLLQTGLTLRQAMGSSLAPRFSAVLARNRPGFRIYATTNSELRSMPRKSDMTPHRHVRLRVGAALGRAY